MYTRFEWLFQKVFSCKVHLSHQFLIFFLAKNSKITIRKEKIFVKNYGSY
jgi:hypothetical protein